MPVYRKLFLLLGLTGLLLGSAAGAIEVEKLVMPGEVIAGHAETEADCSACHKAFARDKQNQLCLDCHQLISTDLSNKRGFHGLNPEIADAGCSSCHTDHIGRDAEIVVFDADDFDHRFADFLLRGAHQEVACKDCHEPAALYREASSVCVACHRDDDAHKGGLGDECASCHVESDWLTVRFDHLAESGFALLGAHDAVACQDCHQDLQFANTPDTCIGCHRSDDVHEGLLGEDCAACHNEQRWTASRFDHNTLTDFPLLGGHAPLECEACHFEPVNFASPGTACADCHGKDDPHDNQLGTDCAACHNERSWLEDVRFDHSLTLFPLFGEHTDVACEGCHETARFLDASTACVDCHQDEDVHNGTLGQNCGACHNPAGWELWRFDHFISAGFLLDGAHAELLCEDCHTEPVDLGMSTSSRCVDCHREDDVHNGEFGRDCERCHVTSTFEEVGEVR